MTDFSIRTLFFKGRPVDEDVSFASIIHHLNEFRARAHAIPVDTYLAFCDILSARWKKNRNLEEKAGAVLTHLADFVSSQNMAMMLDTALRGDRHILDRFMKLDERPYQYHAQPRGIVAQWLAGNVPILGVYSIIQALITKNVVFARPSSRAYRGLLELVYDMADAAREFSDPDILDGVAIGFIPTDNRAQQEALSLAADVRVAWGGAEAIQSIQGLRKHFYTEDIVYGPKYSYAVIDAASLTKKQLSSMALRVAVDVSTFDQYACSSPHTLFVEEGGEVSPQDFAKALSEALERVGRTLLPKDKETPAEISNILTARASHIVSGSVHASPDSTWTVIYSDDHGLADAVFSRVVFVRPIASLDALSEFNDRRKQTLGCAVDASKRAAFADQVSLFGIDRLPALGTMSHYDSPWDGMFGIDRLVRWVSMSDL